MEAKTNEICYTNTKRKKPGEIRRAFFVFSAGFLQVDLEAAPVADDWSAVVVDRSTVVAVAVVVVVVRGSEATVSPASSPAAVAEASEASLHCVFFAVSVLGQLVHVDVEANFVNFNSRVDNVGSSVACQFADQVVISRGGGGEYYDRSQNYKYFLEHRSILSGGRVGFEKLSCESCLLVASHR